jgi:hypothetical protein
VLAAAIRAVISASEYKYGRVRFSLSDPRDGCRCLPVAVSDGRLVWVG